MVIVVRSPHQIQQMCADAVFGLRPKVRHTDEANSFQFDGLESDRPHDLSGMFSVEMAIVVTPLIQPARRDSRRLSNYCAVICRISAPRSSATSI